MQVYEAPLRDMRFVLHELHGLDRINALPAFAEATPDVVDGVLVRSDTRSTWCEWKGPATYWDVRGLTAGAWSYEDPTPGFVDLAGYLAFSPSRLECFVDDERVRPQEGGFYAGWITDDVVGPFKGPPGTLGW